jgi:uncharacterized protein (DUF58 family)
LRYLHWKITAHRDELFVRQMLPALREGCLLLLDRHPHAHCPLERDAGRGTRDEEGETTLDELVRIAAFLLREWLQGGYQVHFWVPPDPPLTVTGKDWHALWRSLALLAPKPYMLPDDFAEQGVGVILTTPLSPFLAQFERAAQAGWLVWQLPWRSQEVAIPSRPIGAGEGRV